MIFVGIALGFGLFVMGVLFVVALCRAARLGDDLIAQCPPRSLDDELAEATFDFRRAS